MLRPFLQLVSLFSALLLQAQGTPKALLWKVQPPGSSSPSYLFGTIHVKDDRVFQFADPVWAAMDSTQITAGELDLEQGRKDPLALMNMMMMPDGKRLEDLYKKKDWLLLEKELKEKLGVMAAMTYRMKPIFVMAMMMQGDLNSDQERVLDDHLLTTARTKDKRVIGIETVEEQMRALDALPLKEQAKMLLDQIKEEGVPVEFDRMIEAYAAQDLDLLVEVAMSSGGMPPSLEKSLITDRNHRIAHRLDSIMTGGETIFLAVGAAHLPGKEGLITLLGSKGYTVLPVMTVAVKEEELVPVEEER
jgi:uncharacterized protein YbaP (TraB family)